PRLFTPAGVVAPDGADRITGRDFVTDPDLGQKAHRWIDVVFNANPATSGFGDGVTYLLGIDLSNKTGARGFYLKRGLCQRKNAAGVLTTPAAHPPGSTVF